MTIRKLVGEVEQNMITDKISSLVDESIKALGSIVKNKMPPNVPRESYIKTTLKHVIIQLNRVNENLEHLEIANAFTQGTGEKKSGGITAEKLAEELTVSVRTVQRIAKDAGIKKTSGVYLFSPEEADIIREKCYKFQGRPSK